MDEQLDPSILEFKYFINQYPRLCEDIQRKKTDVQSLYEKWVVLGADDSYWNKYTVEPIDRSDHQEGRSSTSPTEKNANTNDIIQTLIQATENLDMTKVQTYVEQVSTAVDSVQDVVRQFNDPKPGNVDQQRDPHQTNPFFQWMKD